MFGLDKPVDTWSWRKHQTFYALGRIAEALEGGAVLLFGVSRELRRVR